MSNEEFRVVDRRHSDDGSDDGEEKIVSTPSQSENEQRENEQGENKQRKTKSEELPPVDFASFIVSLGTQAMMFLGEIPDPQGKLMEVNLQGARQTIDIISLIQDKTKGNLSEDESKLLQDILTSLRLAFVNKAKSSQ